MKLLRQVFSIPLITAFICFNTQSADLHVHAAADHAELDHQHGPAVHHHDAGVRVPGNDARLTAVDADDTVILVRLCATSASGAKPTAARCVAVASANRPTLAIVGGTRIVARAHGPPPFRPDSLRAPPASHPL